MGFRAVWDLSLAIACNDILSGEAHRLAEKSGIVDMHLRQVPSRLSPALVEDYVRMRNRLERGAKKSWTGPTAAVIRRDSGMWAYLEERLAEASTSKIRRRKAPTPNLETILHRLIAPFCEIY